MGREQGDVRAMWSVELIRSKDWKDWSVGIHGNDAYAHMMREEIQHTPCDGREPTSVGRLGSFP